MVIFSALLKLSILFTVTFSTHILLLILKLYNTLLLFVFRYADLQLNGLHKILWTAKWKPAFDHLIPWEQHEMGS